MFPPHKKSNVASEASDLGRYAGLGLQFVVTLALFGALGWWLDGLWGTRPWLTVTGILLGSIIAFVGIVKAVPPARSVRPAKPYDESPRAKACEGDSPRAKAREGDSSRAEAREGERGDEPGSSGNGADDDDRDAPSTR